jgi:ribosome-binding factor A
MPSKTQGRVGERIRQIVSELLDLEAQDPRLSGVTVVDQEIDRELAVATLYVTSFEGEEARETVLAGLEAATGFLRREVARRMQLRNVPELRFKWDETASQAAHLGRLLDSLDIPADEEDTADGRDEEDAAS